MAFHERSGKQPTVWTRNSLCFVLRKSCYSFTHIMNDALPVHGLKLFTANTGVKRMSPSWILMLGVAIVDAKTEFRCFMKLRVFGTSQESVASDREAVQV